MGFVLSSTAVIMQTLDEKNEINTPAGQRAVSILLLEDLAIVPLLAVVAVLATMLGVAEDGPPLWQTIGLAVAAIAGVFVAGRYAINPIFRQLAKYGGREVMLAAALLVVEIAFVSQNRAVGTFADDAAHTVGVARRDAIRKGEAPDPVAVAAGELVLAEAAIGAALEEGHIGRQDLFGAGLAAGNDVHDDRIALHIDTRSPAPDQLDALDLGDQGPRQDRGAGVVLGRRPRSIDQDIADRALETPRAIAVLDGETGHAADHVEGGVRSLVCEEVRGEDQDALL
jgi:hypothetical protein